LPRLLALPGLLLLAWPRLLVHGALAFRCRRSVRCWGQTRRRRGVNLRTFGAQVYMWHVQIHTVFYRANTYIFCKKFTGLFKIFNSTIEPKSNKNIKISLNHLVKTTCTRTIQKRRPSSIEVVQNLS
jgi:hypothetical protein